MVYITYALVPGSPTDRYGNNVVAVVGQIEPGSIATTVVARNMSNARSNDRCENPIVVDAVPLHEDDVVQSLSNEPLM